jgi:hypothetical protein
VTSACLYALACVYPCISVPVPAPVTVPVPAPAPAPVPVLVPVPVRAQVCMHALPTSIECSLPVFFASLSCCGGVALLILKCPKKWPHIPPRNCTSMRTKLMHATMQAKEIAELKNQLSEAAKAAAAATIHSAVPVPPSDAEFRAQMAVVRAGLLLFPLGSTLCFLRFPLGSTLWRNFAVGFGVAKWHSHSSGPKQSPRCMPLWLLGAMPVCADSAQPPKWRHRSFVIAEIPLATPFRLLCLNHACFGCAVRVRVKLPSINAHCLQIVSLLCWVFL